MYPLSITMSDISNSDYGIIFACGVMFMIPALIIYFYGHKDIDLSLSDFEKSGFV